MVVMLLVVKTPSSFIFLIKGLISHLDRNFKKLPLQL